MWRGSCLRTTRKVLAYDNLRTTAVKRWFEPQFGIKISDHTRKHKFQCIDFYDNNPCTFPQQRLGPRRWAPLTTRDIPKGVQKPSMNETQPNWCFKTDSTPRLRPQREDWRQRCKIFNEKFASLWRTVAHWMQSWNWKRPTYQWKIGWD